MMKAQQIGVTTGTQDGSGAGDHDVHYRFGHRPTSATPYPFSTRQYARLLLLRSRIQAGLVGGDDAGAEHLLRWLPDEAVFRRNPPDGWAGTIHEGTSWS